MSCPFLESISRSPELRECPLGFTSSARTSIGGESSHSTENNASSAPAAVCPLGFGSSAASAGPRLTHMHCCICKTFMHEPVRCTPCTHVFCRFCISGVRDCPVCGQDVESLQPDEHVQGLVDRFLAAHASDGAGLLSPEEIKRLSEIVGSSCTSTSIFFYRLGLQAMAGGNLEAALHRLELCKRELYLTASREQQQQQQQEACDNVTQQQQQQQQQQQACDDGTEKQQQKQQPSCADEHPSTSSAPHQPQEVAQPSLHTGSPFHTPQQPMPQSRVQAHATAQQQQQQQQQQQSEPSERENSHQQQQQREPATCPFHRTSASGTPSTQHTASTDNSHDTAPNPSQPPRSSQPPACPFHRTSASGTPSTQHTASTDNSHDTAPNPSQPPRPSQPPTCPFLRTSASGAASGTPSTQHAQGGGAGSSGVTVSEEAPVAHSSSSNSASHPHPQIPKEVACQLGAVWGTQGDCCKQLKDLAKAASHYEASIQCLQCAAEDGDAEATHALSVSYNKLGDLHFIDQDLHKAVEVYHQGLCLRRQLLQNAVRVLEQHAAEAAANTAAGAEKEAAQPRRCSKNNQDQKERGVCSKEHLLGWQQAADVHASKVLDVVASLIKIADAMSAMSDDSERQRALQEEARSLLHQVQPVASAPVYPPDHSLSPINTMRCIQLTRVLEALTCS